MTGTFSNRESIGSRRIGFVEKGSQASEANVEFPAVKRPTMIRSALIIDAT